MCLSQDLVSDRYVKEINKEYITFSFFFLTTLDCVMWLIFAVSSIASSLISSPENNSGVGMLTSCETCDGGDILLRFGAEFEEVESTRFLASSECSVPGSSLIFFTLSPLCQAG